MICSDHLQMVVSDRSQTIDSDRSQTDGSHHLQMLVFRSSSDGRSQIIFRWLFSYHLQAVGTDHLQFVGCRSSSDISRSSSESWKLVLISEVCSGIKLRQSSEIDTERVREENFHVHHDFSNVAMNACTLCG